MSWTKDDEEEGSEQLTMQIPWRGEERVSEFADGPSTSVWLSGWLHVNSVLRTLDTTWLRTPKLDLQGLFLVQAGDLEVALDKALECCTADWLLLVHSVAFF